MTIIINPWKNWVVFGLIKDNLTEVITKEFTKFVWISQIYKNAFLLALSHPHSYRFTYFCQFNNENHFKVGKLSLIK